MTVALDVGHGHDDGAPVVVDAVLLDIGWDGIERLTRLFPGVDPRRAAVALLLDALDEAEAINRKDEA